MASVLITGATGLIGQAVLGRWEAEAGDAVPMNGRGTQDLLEAGRFAAAIREHAPDAVLHLAWCSGSEEAYRTSSDNERWVSVSLDAARLCRQAGIRFLAMGTVLDDGVPADAYSRSKRQLRDELDPDIQSGSITWLRPFYVFDPGRDRPRVLESARTDVAAGRPALLRQPEARHDFIHVNDVATGVVAALRHGLTGAIDIGSGISRPVSSLVSRAGMSWQADPSVEVVHHVSQVADTAPLRSTGWVAHETDRYFGDD